MSHNVLCVVTSKFCLWATSWYFCRPIYRVA